MQLQNRVTLVCNSEGNPEIKRYKLEINRTSTKMYGNLVKHKLFGCNKIYFWYDRFHLVAKILPHPTAYLKNRNPFWPLSHLSGLCSFHILSYYISRHSFTLLPSTVHSLDLAKSGTLSRSLEISPIRKGPLRARGLSIFGSWNEILKVY